MASGGNLVWMDMEMSGLDPERDVILELATVITDADLNIVAEGPVIAISQPASLFDSMDQWNRDHHTKSGLWDRVLRSTTTLEQAEEATLAFIKTHVAQRQSPLCGNSIWQDRRFIARYMKHLDAYLHYRLIDVSTVKELARRWYGASAEFKDKKKEHLALADIRESVAELRFYRQALFAPNVRQGEK